jgi:hypothetical protein
MVLQAETKYIALSLDRAGIMSVETPDDTAVEDLDSAHSPEARSGVRNDATDVRAAGESTPSPHSDSSVTLAGDEYISASYAGPSTPSRLSRLLSHVQLSPRATPGPANFVSLNYGLSNASINTAYLTLLQSVVNIARTSSLPNPGASNMAAITDLLNGASEPFQLRGLDKLTRDKLIGAAGELFVSYNHHLHFVICHSDSST